MCRSTDWNLYLDVLNGKRKLRPAPVKLPKAPKIPAMKRGN